MSASWDGDLRVWDIASGECLRLIKSGGIACLRLSADGRLAFVGCPDHTLRAWDLKSGVLVAVFCMDSTPQSISEPTPEGLVVCGTEGGVVNCLELKGHSLEPPIVTIFRRWRWGVNQAASRWDDELTAICPHCAVPFVPIQRVVARIRRLRPLSSILSSESPCLEGHRDIWDDSTLISECAACKRSVKFNPIVLDRQSRV